MITLPTVLAWIEAGGALIPEAEALLAEVKSLFSDDEQSQIDAVAALNAEADKLHNGN